MLRSFLSTIALSFFFFNVVLLLKKYFTETIVAVLGAMINFLSSFLILPSHLIYPSHFFSTDNYTISIYNVSIITSSSNALKLCLYLPLSLVYKFSKLFLPLLFLFTISVIFLQLGIFDDSMCSAFYTYSILRSVYFLWLSVTSITALSGLSTCTSLLCTCLSPLQCHSIFITCHIPH